MTTTTGSCCDLGRELNLFRILYETSHSSINYDINVAEAGFEPATPGL